MKITNDILYAGVHDGKIDLFEGQYKVKDGISYNSYIIKDEKIAVFDTVDAAYKDEWLDNIKSALKGENPHYLIVLHMEPDHSANILDFVRTYPEAKIVASKKAFAIMQNFFLTDFPEKQLVVADGDVLSLGKHNLTFFTAPMVHWPEVLVAFDSYDKALFSADAFGKFGKAEPGGDWTTEARRYYIGIVGKYGAQVQALLKKVSGLDIRLICPLHGPVLSDNLGYYIEKYDLWSSYKPEEEGVLIAYTSVYGNTKKAAKALEKSLLEKGEKAECLDLARCDMSYAVSRAFKLSKLILATTTYNADIFPFMREFINHLTERNFSNRTVGFIENGSWAPSATRVMKAMLEKCKNLEFLSSEVSILSALSPDSEEQLQSLTEEIVGK